MIIFILPILQILTILLFPAILLILIKKALRGYGYEKVV